MLTFLLTCLFCTGAVLFVWFLSRTRPERGRQLHAFAAEQGYRYSSRQPFSSELRFRQFRLLASAAAAYGRHWISDDETLFIFDCTTLGKQGAAESSVILMHCPVPLEGRLCLSRRAWFSEDNFTPFHGTPLKRLQQEDIPTRLSDWCCLCDSRHRMRPWFRSEVIDWLLAHASLHVEWSDGWLLVCQPGYRIAADELDTALKDVLSLASHLQSLPSNTGSSH